MRRFQQTLRNPLFNEMQKIARERDVKLQDVVREACEEWFHWQKKTGLKEGPG